MSWSAEIRVRRDDFALDVALQGDAGVVALVGPNGSGKTTVLRILAGAVEPDYAEIEVAAQVVASTAGGIDVPMERRRMGYVPQGYGLFPHLSVIDNVAFGLSTWPHRLEKSERHARAQRLLDELDCGALAQRRVGRLSGGEQQRVALARALVIEPKLLLLDEPLAALDATTRRTVRRFLAEHLPSFQRPCVLVTHDVRDVEALATDVVVLERGQVVQRGTLEALRAAPASDFVAEFVGAR